MENIFTQITKDLVLPEGIVESLRRERSNQELKMYALSIPDLVYPDTYKLSGRLLIYMTIKECPQNVREYVTVLSDILQKSHIQFMLDNEDIINSVLEETYSKNYEDCDLISGNALNNYTLKLSAEELSIETPCQMMFRLAVQFYLEEGIDRVIECYYSLLDKSYIHASPTLFNSGTKKNQLSSCFLICLEDSLESLLYTGAGDVGTISKLQGGIGLNMSSIRHSSIANTGKSSGVMPFARIIDSTIRCVDQGGKRNGAGTITLIDWHIDILEFIQCRDPTNERVIKLEQANTCIFLSSLFMERVKRNEKWTLFCPRKARMMLHGKEIALSYNHGKDFEEIYPHIEREAIMRKNHFEEFNREVEELSKYVAANPEDEEERVRCFNMKKRRIEMRKNLIDYKQIDASEMYRLIADMQVKSSMPYVVYRDTVNYKNNMKNVFSTENLNLCVAPETYILTKRGYKMISRLENTVQEVWNGKEFSKVEIKKTAENVPIMKIKFNNGTVIECTPEHKFYIYNNYKELEVRAKDLRPGDKIYMRENLPIIEGDRDITNAYSSGFYTGANIKNNSIYLKGKNWLPILKKLNWEYRTLETENQFVVKPNKKELSNEIPFNDISIRSRLEWISGLFDASGNVYKISDNVYTFCIHLKDEFIYRKIYLLFQTFGILAKKAIDINNCMIFDNKQINKLITLGLEKKDIFSKITDNCIDDSIFVESIIDEGRTDDTYCFNEPLRHRGVFNGILTGQCLEIIQPCRGDEIASCNLAHINLKYFTKGELRPSDIEGMKAYDFEKLTFKEKTKRLRECYDFDALARTTRNIVENINKVIDKNYYPLDKRDSEGNVIERGKISGPNFRHRPMGIGVSGLAETFNNLNIYYVSEESKLLNKMIFACMYYSGLQESLRLAERDGEYESFRSGSFEAFIGEGERGEWQTFEGSPLSNGMFQFDMWDQEAQYLKSIGRLNTKIYKEEDNIPIEPREWGGRGSWATLRKLIMKNGVRNSMLLAPMPTASSAQVFNNAETTEAHQTLIYSRKLVTGNFLCYSEPFVRDMIKYKLWNSKLINFIMLDRGSIANIDKFVLDFPELFSEEFYVMKNSRRQLSDDIAFIIEHLKNKHKNMYEISQKETMLMARQRGIYVDQSQSLNIYLRNPTIDRMKAIHSYGEALKLKTGMYYLRSEPGSATANFTISAEEQQYYFRRIVQGSDLDRHVTSSSAESSSPSVENSPEVQSPETQGDGKFCSYYKKKISEDEYATCIHCE